MKITLRTAYLVALSAAWLGYFSPWIAPGPAGLRLSAHDLVEWMTFVQTVRDGTYPVTRLDLLWPLAGIALLTALAVSYFQDTAQPSDRPVLASVFFRPLHLGFLALALFAAYLILPAYPFVLTAYRDPELAPQFWLGAVAALAALPAVALAALRPVWARRLASLMALASAAAAVRAVVLVRPPIADMLAGPVPVGYGWVLAAAGLAAMGVILGISLGPGRFRRTS